MMLAHEENCLLLYLVYFFFIASFMHITHVLSFLWTCIVGLCLLGGLFIR